MLHALALVLERLGKEQVIQSGEERKEKEDLGSCNRPPLHQCLDRFLKDYLFIGKLDGFVQSI